MELARITNPPLAAGVSLSARDTTARAPTNMIAVMRTAVMARVRIFSLHGTSHGLAVG
jgi:hypothetical protein